MKSLVIANWKANPATLAGAKKLLFEIKKGLGKKLNVDIIVCPPFVFLPGLNKITGKNIKLGSQDVFWKEGAFTGQVSAKMLKDVGCKYVIVGHSERRAIGETNKRINQKIKACLAEKITPILCVGETNGEKETGKTFRILRNQIKEGLESISRNQVGKIVIAYEPVWAISTTSNRKNCDFEDALGIQILIRKIILETYNRPISKKIRIIFGGNVRSNNILGYIKEARMEGALVGGASLDSKEFIAILKKF
ncbi:MAG: triose-phosphate isomerase [Patescibacteria group bacterium]|nr:triose-phosphate isomerase [Patescibacteria group bacterium]